MDEAVKATGLSPGYEGDDAGLSSGNLHNPHVGAQVKRRWETQACFADMGTWCLRPQLKVSNSRVEGGSTTNSHARGYSMSFQTGGRNWGCFLPSTDYVARCDLQRQVALSVCCVCPGALRERSYTGWLLRRCCDSDCATEECSWEPNPMHILEAQPCQVVQRSFRRVGPKL